MSHFSDNPYAGHEVIHIVHDYPDGDFLTLLPPPNDQLPPIYTCNEPHIAQLLQDSVSIIGRRCVSLVFNNNQQPVGYPSIPPVSKSHTGHIAVQYLFRLKPTSQNKLLVENYKKLGKEANSIIKFEQDTGEEYRVWSMVSIPYEQLSAISTALQNAIDFNNAGETKQGAPDFQTMVLDKYRAIEILYHNELHFLKLLRRFLAISSARQDISASDPDILQNQYDQHHPSRVSHPRYNQLFRNVGRFWDRLHSTPIDRAETRAIRLFSTQEEGEKSETKTKRNSLKSKSLPHAAAPPPPLTKLVPPSARKITTNVSDRKKSSLSKQNILEQPSSVKTPKNKVPSTKKTPQRKSKMGDDGDDDDDDDDADDGEDDQEEEKEGDEEDEGEEDSSSKVLRKRTKTKSTTPKKATPKKATPKKATHTTPTTSSTGRKKVQEYFIEKILDWKLLADHTPLFLIKWVDFGSKYNSWEPLACLTSSSAQLDAKETLTKSGRADLVAKFFK